MLHGQHCMQHEDIMTTAENLKLKHLKFTRGNEIKSGI